ncbi:MAG: preprotein translocase subunit SecA [Armatimonadota bacterium]
MAFALDSLKRVVDPNEREIARMRKRVVQINALEPEIQALTDEQLGAKTAEFRQRLAQGETVDDLLPEAFAVVREAARRVLGERHYDVQLIGGMILHEGKIAEMRTGEGKTLTATLPMYLNALPAKGVHVITTNDFLVRWQAEWMGQVFALLGMSVGYIQHAMPDAERRSMYLRDITYVENSELGFDYLRDNMAVHPSRLCLRNELHYAIVDEADSILIDEARTPLIISGETEEESQNYRRADDITRKLLRASKEDDDPLYTWDKKDNQASLTEAGQNYVEKELHLEGSLVDPENIEIAQLVENSLKAHKLYEKDVKYVVMDGEVVIVDEFTGHLQPGRRYSDGLHQAIEAKERVFTPRVRQTVATITYQNFFRLYSKLAGMTGTAKSEEQEFTKIYGCRVVICPTNKPVIRKDHADTVFKTEEAKFRGMLNEIISCHVREQPVLVGTRSVEVSEHLAGRLRQDWVQAHVLVQVLLGHVHATGKELGRDEKDAFLAALRQPTETLVDQARYLKRRAGNAPIPKQKKRRKGDEEEKIEVTLGDIVAHFGLPEEITDQKHLDYYLQMLNIIDDKTPADTRQRYEERLAKLVTNGMRPGDEDHESQLNVLNAKRHEAEGTIIARAGEAGMVTIATNMAGRGVDIILGGRNPEKGTNIFPERYEYVKARGGLHVIGSERHESRRIDDQLRGRAGRQGDPGSSRFYVSLQDELMQLFGPDRFSFAMNNWPEEEAIEARLISRAIERAQEKVELRNFGYRKNTLEYDDVMNQQRTVIYSQRRRVLNGENVQAVILRMIDDTAARYLEESANKIHQPSEWEYDQLYKDLVRIFSTPPEDEGKQARGKKRGGSGIAVALAERDLLAMADGGEDVAAYLREHAFPFGTLRRNVDHDTAENMLRDEIAKTVDEVLADFCPQDRPVDEWRMGDVVRVLEERYEGIADVLGHEGLLAIPADALHDEIRRMVHDVYIGRERIKIDLEIEKAVRHYAPAERPVDQINYLELLEYLEYYLHDFAPRLAVDALQATDSELATFTADHLLSLHDQIVARQLEKSNNREEEARGLALSQEQLRPAIAELATAHLSIPKPAPVEFVKALAMQYPVGVLGLAAERLRQLAGPQLNTRLRDAIREEPEEGESPIGLKEFRGMERYWLLSSVDKAWIHHLLNMDELRDGIHLRSHAQRDPLIEYQREASDLFEQLMLIISQRTTQKAFSGTEAAEMDGFLLRGLQTQSSDMPTAGPTRTGTVQNNEPKIRRNDPCPCGSGKKYKVCCMKD